MKIKEDGSKIYPYTRNDGLQVEKFLFNNGFHAVLIGSLSHGKESEKDIDILLPYNNLTWFTKRKLLKIFGCKNFVITDWGGLFMYNTYFGDIDIFFKGQDEEFDY